MLARSLRRLTTRRTLLSAASAWALFVGFHPGGRRAHAQSATPVVMSPPAAPAEVLLSTTFPAGVLPQGPAAVEFWYSNWDPGFEYLAEEYHPAVSVGGDLVLSGAWGTRSDAAYLVWRDGRFEETPVNQEVVLQPGEAVIYLDNAANEWIRNAAETATETANFAITLGGGYEGSNLGVDWEESGLSGHDVTVTIERQILGPGEALTVTPDAAAPALPLVVEGSIRMLVYRSDGQDPPFPVVYSSGTTIPFLLPKGGGEVELSNAGDEPVVLLTMIMTAVDDSDATPTA